MTWPNGVIPYVISASYSSRERGIIGQAMAEITAKTCLRFIPRTSSHRDYIHIYRGKGVVIHELMHAVGFWHEQSRPDRDTYVTINWANILQAQSYNFQKVSNTMSTDLGLAYDYDSVMHYGAYDFARDRSRPTITPRRSGVTIGQRRGLSQLDARGLNLLYRCPSTGPITTTTTNRPTPTTCNDYNSFCSSWAFAGYCSYNPGYMNIYCQKSCDLCGEF
ncbi:hypothetical protein Pcinc_019751 [Petrolisthes cinctipes]|uniref:Metalloendopeptidase n=1 Tax=Petrolisthes cinctipes TaxID=88211 RepID=A0AAE1FJJ2_PETCI|nr:hypothetical protein Pcinc_019751 [Petrolisthes cinctipes]